VPPSAELLGALALAFAAGSIAAVAGFGIGSILTPAVALLVATPVAVATATAVALFVDGARVPVYLASNGSALIDLAPLIAAMTLGVVLGTGLGAALLGRIPERLFRRAVGVLLVALGVFMAVAGS
jgi:uncharacterized membrane protein YfcA